MVGEDEELAHRNTNASTIDPSVSDIDEQISPNVGAHACNSCNTEGNSHATNTRSVELKDTCL